MARPWNFYSFIIRVYDEKLGHMLKPLVSKFRHDLSARLKDIAEKQVSAKPKHIVGITSRYTRSSGTYKHFQKLTPLLKKSSLMTS